MSAHDQIRAMLDQLMGTGRDGENNKYKVKFDDPRVCKSFLLGCCPHEILASTRMDLGECPKIHDLALKADYEMASVRKDYYYDIDAMEHLQSFIADCDRRTELAKRRLKETQEELSEEANAKAEVIHQLGEQIGTKLAKAEEVGGEGNVDESLAAMNEVEEFKKKKAQAEIEYRNSMPASSYQQQKLRVCEVCSAYLGIHDNDRRLADHFGGKLHLGFITIREKLSELQAKIEASPQDVTVKSVQERRLQREREREERRRERDENEKRRSQSSEREKEREREREREREKDKERERDRDRDRDRESRRSRRRSRSRSRSNSHSHDRDRRRRRSRSRERSRRHRSKSRSRERRRHSKSRERRSRSRSGSRRSRSRRSRSGSRSRRRSKRSRSRSRSKSKRSKSRSRSRSRSKRSRHSRSAEKSRSKSPKKSKERRDENGDSLAAAENHQE